MEIAISDLQRLCTILLDHVEDLGVKSIEMDVDYYWEILGDELYDPTKDCADLGLTLGQLSHDWERLSDMLSGNSEPLSVGLVWLSSILRRIGQKVFV